MDEITMLALRAKAGDDDAMEKLRETTYSIAWKCVRGLCPKDISGPNMTADEVPWIVADELMRGIRSVNWDSRRQSWEAYVRGRVNLRLRDVRKGQSPVCLDDFVEDRDEIPPTLDWKYLTAPDLEEPWTALERRESEREDKLHVEQALDIICGLASREDWRVFQDVWWNETATYQETARELGKPEGTLKCRNSRLLSRAAATARLGS